MPTLRDIKGHISSVRNIAKVTRAMEMVSAARNHRLLARVESTQVFADKSWEVLNHLTSAAESGVRENPLFCGYSEVNRVGMLLISSDRGMVDGYDANIIGAANQYIAAHKERVQVITIGKVGRTAMLRQSVPIHAEFTNIGENVEIGELTPVARVLLDGFTNHLFDQVVIAYTQFRSGVRLKPTIKQLLPICPEATSDARAYLYEPSPSELLMALLPRLVRFQVYQALLESLAAENTSRMAAMHAATQNAGDIIEGLTISYNKARQQAITSEILDILGGTSTLNAPQE
ncbi:MAG: ATP synthase F1 subunit gamma [Chloroflexi bacterium]|nr:ATP synthase F1 subunit gamma [Chloroflexota bacterium]